MEISATAKYIRISTRKARLVADSVRMAKPMDAIVSLRALAKRGGKLLADVISSALANAKQKTVDASTLRIKAIEVMGGPVMKRWHAVSRGQAHGFKKRMTHIRVVLTDEEKNVNTTNKQISKSANE